jgi:hypothetical protein
MRADFAVQLIKSIEDLLEDLVTSGREPVQARRLGARRLCRAQPTALGHPRQHGIQRPWTQAIAVMVELLQHPLTIDAVFGGVVEDVNLPEREEEFTDDGISHDPPIVALHSGSRYSMTRRIGDQPITHRPLLIAVGRMKDMETHAGVPAQIAVDYRLT